jgi:hypothetical protein
MRIARVQTALAPDQARRTFEEGLEQARRRTDTDAPFLLYEARLCAAAVAPDVIAGIPETCHLPRQLVSDTIGRIMLGHGHVNAAVSYLLEQPIEGYPFRLAASVLGKVEDAEQRLEIFRNAVAAWRQTHDDHFDWLLHSQWKRLPLIPTGR